MERPFFSIILPTKDRVALAADVIRHTLNQSFRDFELVVVDNGAEAGASRAAMGFGDARVRIVRTGGLNMPDNWQAGLDAANGEYYLMIEDKLFLVEDALERCAQLIKKSEAPLLSWMLGTCDHANCPSLAAVGDCSAREISSNILFHYGAECMLDRYHKQAPRGLNMAIQRSLVEDVQIKSGRMCRAMAPDYSMGALPLAFTPNVLHANKVLARVLRTGPSTGSDVWRRNEGCGRFFQSLGVRPEQLLDMVPLKVPFLQNLILSDLFRCWRSAGITEEHLKIHIGGYFMMLLSELLIAKNNDIPYLKEAKLIRDLFWNQPLKAKAEFFPYALKRYIQGWPDRKAKMRVNAFPFFLALSMLFYTPSAKCSS